MNDLFEIYLFQFLNISLSNIIGFITIVVYNVYKLYNVLYAFVHYYTLKFSRGIESKINFLPNFTSVSLRDNYIILEQKFYPFNKKKKQIFRC